MNDAQGFLFVKLIRQKRVNLTFLFCPRAFGGLYSCDNNLIDDTCCV